MWLLDCAPKWMSREFMGIEDVEGSVSAKAWIYCSYSISQILYA